MRTHQRRRAARGHILALALFLALLPSAELRAQLLPFTLDEVARLIKRSVPPSRIRDIVGPRCAGFVWTPATEDHLRAAGANDATLEVVREVCKSLPPPQINPQLRLDATRLAPHVAAYRITGRPDRLIRQITRETVDGHVRLRFTTITATGSDSTYAETVFDRRSLAPVYYVYRSFNASETAEIELWPQGDSIQRAGERTGKDPGSVWYPATAATLLPFYQNLILMTATNLRAGQHVTFPTFTANTAAPCTLTVRVERERNVQMPAGRFAAWQVLTSGDCGASQRLLVSREPPYVILGAEGDHARLELVSIEMLPDG